MSLAAAIFAVVSRRHQLLAWHRRTCIRKLDTFEKVKKAIDEMRVALKQEQEAEKKKKASAPLRAFFWSSLGQLRPLLLPRGWNYC